jgi:hypothetical protein
VTMPAIPAQNAYTAATNASSNANEPKISTNFSSPSRY